MASKGMKGLQLWCKQNTEGYKDVEIKNMSSSWKDGLAFCALIHNFRPDLIDFDSLSKENVLYNNQLAFSIAEQELEINSFLDAEDMANMKSPDKLSIITYVSQYYNVFHNQTPATSKKRAASTVQNPDILAKKKSLDNDNQVKVSINVCSICNKKVHLVQRYFKDGQLYHRTCYRTQSLGKMYKSNKPIEKSPTKSLNDIPDHRIDKGVKSASGTAVLPENKSPQETRKDSLNLPSLLSPSEKGNFKAYSSSPSRMQEEKEFSTTQPSLISELPKPVPKPRSRPSSYEAEESPKPAARKYFGSKPKSEDLPPGSKYNKELNPFEDDSSHGTPSISSDSTGEYDDIHNPFTEVPPGRRNFKTTSPVVTPNRFDEEEEKEGGNPFGDTSSQDGNQDEEEDEGKNPFDEESESESTMKQKSTNPFSDESDDNATENNGESLNPFGEPDSEEENIIPKKPHVTLNKTNSSVVRLNPFSEEYEEKCMKSPPPVPPPPRRKKKAAPTPPQTKPSVKSPTVEHTPPPQPPTSPLKQVKQPPQRKSTAPPVPDWKEKSMKEMEKMNEMNKSDGKYENKFSSLENNQTTVKSPPRSPNNRARSNGKVKKPTRQAPGYGFPLVKRKVETTMSESEIKQELKILDVQLSDLEVKGVKLEELLRFAMEPGADWTPEDDLLLKEWLDLVREKNQMVRRETDLVFLMQQQRLEQEHADVEFKLRALMNKPDGSRTEEDKQNEERLLERLLDIVERRNVIINSIEEERVKEEEEDYAYEQMKHIQTLEIDKKKKKSKVKKIFKIKKKHKSQDRKSQQDSSASTQS